jgi:multidrug efflux system outer membrane protein
MIEIKPPRAAFGVTPQGAMPTDRQSRIGGIPGWVTSLMAVGLLSACSQLPVYQRPAVEVPAAFPSAAAPAAASARALDWQDFVTDPALRQLVAQALEHNRDLRVAVLQIEQARAQFQIRRADAYPTVNAAATGSRQPSSSGDGITSAYTAGLAVASWELDLFGRIASLREAALAQFLASEENRKAVQISLVAAVSNAWLGLQNTEAQLALTRQTLDTRRESLRLTQLRFDAGTATALDLRGAESLVASAESTLAQLQQQRAQGLNALDLLVGKPATAASAPVAAPDFNARLPLAEVPVGLPSDVLLERPDVRAAEQSLVAANAQIGAARAAFFPRISLTASAGTASNHLSGLFSSGSWGWTLAPQALLPIFDAGRNQAGLESAQAGRQLAVAQYEKAIQTAFKEVADALVAREPLAEQWRAQQALVASETERARLTDLRLNSGVASQLELLDAQRSLFSAQQALLQTRLALAQNQVALYKALGGGWKTPG